MDERDKRNTTDEYDDYDEYEWQPTDHLIVQLSLACFLMLLWLCLARYEGYNAGMFDLGTMSQSIWTGTQGQALMHTAPDIGPRSRLNVHVEIFYALLIPLYMLWSDPRLLLIVQAVLFLFGAAAVYDIAMRRTDNVFAARCLTLIYLFYPTAQTSVLFDFHGDTLAMPLLLMVISLVYIREWSSYAVFVGLAMVCKFYVVIPIAGIGFYILLSGVFGRGRERGLRFEDIKVGLLTLVAAATYGAFAFLLVRPLAAPVNAGDIHAATNSYITHYFGTFADLLPTAGDRLMHAIIVFGPVMLIAWRGWRWLIIGVPVALAMLLSDESLGGGYDFRYHHYATVVPFIVMATIDGVARKQALQDGEPGAAQPAPSAPSSHPAPRRKKGRPWRADLGIVLGSVLLFNILLVDTPLNPLFWFKIPGQGLDPSAYGVTPRDDVKDRFLVETGITTETKLATSTLLAPHQSNRETLYLVRYPDDPGAERLPDILPEVDAVTTDALFDYYIPIDETSYGGGVDYEREAIGVTMRDPSFNLTLTRDGLLLFKRDAAPHEVLTQTVEVIEDAGIAPHTLFGEEISLYQAEIAKLGKRRFRATFEWLAIGPDPPAQDYVGVSTFEGLENERFVHLPTYALHPPTRWQPGDLIRETIDIELSHDVQPGEYTWRVAWYRVDHPYSYATDRRSILPESQKIVVGKVEVER